MVADSLPRSEVYVLDVGRKDFEGFPNVASALAIAQRLQLKCSVQKPGGILLVSSVPEFKNGECLHAAAILLDSGDDLLPQRRPSPSQYLLQVCTFI
jgi:hypothetical protein